MPEEIADLLPDEPLPVRLMNTLWADRQVVHDDLAGDGPAGVERLRQWAARAGLAGTEEFGPDDLAAFRRLRDALRRIAAHVTGDERPAATAADLGGALAVLNADLGSCAPALLLDERGGLGLRWHPGPREPDRSRAELALAAARLFAGERAGLLRACYGPGCVLYYCKDHPRRGWCSAGCGNRARVARHYDRHRVRRGR